jgi:hypothetical protein
LRREGQNAASAGVARDRSTENPQSGEGIAQKHFTAKLFEWHKAADSTPAVAIRTEVFEY